jgi:ABC-type spermidine/putrescine transport system permease subunit I
VLVISWLVALYVRLTASRFAKVVSALSVTPLFIPVVISSYAILTFYAPDGFLHNLAITAGLPGFPRVSYTLSAVTIGEVWVNLPFGVLLMTSGLHAVPNVLIDAARDAGSSLTRTVRSILIPMNIVPTVIVGTFTAIYVLGSFTVPYITGPNAPNLLGTAMTFSFMSYGRPQQAEVLSAIVFVLAAGIGTVYVWANVRAERRSGTRR